MQGLNLGPDHQYNCVNESYYQAVLLQFYQRVEGLYSSTIEIQNITVRILNLVRQIDLRHGPSLGVLLYFPVFSAGCGAVHAVDRQHVRNILASIVNMIGFVNVRQGSNILESLWSHRDRYGESELNCSWEKFVGKL